MTHRWLFRSLILAGGCALAMTGVQAQDRGYDPPPPSQPGYDQPPPAQAPRAYQGNGQYYPEDGQSAPPDDYADAPPPDYDASRPPPPPPGYRPEPGPGQYPAQDQRYEAYAEQWAQNNCVRAPNNTGAGAVIGGLLGALVGSGVSGRGDHGTGALVGGIAGAAGGAAIGSESANATSPGCPPGYVVRGGAPVFAYDYGPDYLYAAPGWYQPWYFYGGRWLYRPYPYHNWYYRHYYGRGFYGRHYFHGRPGYYRHRWRGRR